jgi:3-dehydrosphinganine reductase
MCSLELTNLPKYLFCVAGGIADEIGFFADMDGSKVQSCMSQNYLSAAYIAQSCLQLWISHGSTDARHIVFVASTAALVSVPGYALYAPTKAAIRALADCLRSEMLLYSSRQTIKVHCAFPGNFVTEAFLKEQEIKPELCKILEGSGDKSAIPSAAQVADEIISGVKNGKYFITMDFQTALLLNNMRGPSPRDSPFYDWILGLLASFIWPVYRFLFDWQTQCYGKEMNS